jgi:hypothetical protein
MPLRFSDLARGTKAAVLDLGDGDVIRFRFRHGLITPRLMHDFLALDESHIQRATADEQEATMMAISAHLARLMTEWDVLDADGTSMFPLDADRLASDIPLLVQVRLLRTCLAEMAPGEAPAAEDSATGPASAAGSSPTARSAKSRRGTR